MAQAGVLSSSLLTGCSLACLNGWDWFQRTQAHVCLAKEPQDVSLSHQITVAAEGQLTLLPNTPHMQISSSGMAGTNPSRDHSISFRNIFVSASPKKL